MLSLLLPGPHGRWRCSRADRCRWRSRARSPPRLLPPRHPWVLSMYTGLSGPSQKNRHRTPCTATDDPFWKWDSTISPSSLLAAFDRPYSSLLVFRALLSRSRSQSAKKHPIVIIRRPAHPRAPRNPRMGITSQRWGAKLQKMTLSCAATIDSFMKFSPDLFRFFPGDTRDETRSRFSLSVLFHCFLPIIVGASGIGAPEIVPAPCPVEGADLVVAVRLVAI